MLFITGASGLVGGEVLRRMAAGHSPPRLIALCRATTPEAACQTVWGDVRRPLLGLEAGTYRRLQGEVSQIIHCAADTRFGLDLEAARAANATGTAHLLDFARGCRQLRKLAHLSTVYVAGNRTGDIPEQFLPPATRFFNTYQQSKYEAEQLLERAADELPVMLFRLSSLAGDSTTGRIRRFTYVHQLIRLLPRNILEMAPGDPAAPLDLIPTDYAADALLYIFQRGFTPGTVCHICARPQQSLSLQQMLKLTLDVISTQANKRGIQVPQFVTLEEYERYTQQQAAQGSELLRQVLRGLSYFLPHLALRQEFSNANTCRALEGSGIGLPPVTQYFPKVVAYCLASSRS